MFHEYLVLHSIPGYTYNSQSLSAYSTTIYR